MLQRRSGAIFSSLLKLHLSLDITILDIFLASGGLLEKVARVELFQSKDERYGFVQLIRDDQIKLSANLMAET